MMPFVIGAIGDRWYGLWILAGSFTGYFGVLDFGLSTANERFISRSLGTGDDEEVNVIFNTSLFLFVLAGVLTILVSVGIAVVTQYFVEDALDVRIFKFIILASGVTMAVSLPTRAFEGVLFAHIQFYVMNLTDTLKLLLRTALLVYYLSRGQGIITLAIISLGSEMIYNIIISLIVIRRFPELKIGLSYVTRERMKPLFGYSIYSFISNVADKLKYHLDAFVITVVLGLSLVTHYNIGSRISNYYILFITAATALVIPVFSTFEGIGDYDKIREKFIFFTKMNTILSMFLGGTIIIYGKAFISRWMGTGYLDAYDVLMALMIGSIVTTIQITSKSLLYGLSKHRMYAITVIFEGIANLVLSLILVRRFGILGVAMGTTIPALVVNLFILPYYAIRVIDLPVSKYLRTNAGPILFGAAVHIGCWLLVRNYVMSSYRIILLLGAGTSTIFILANIIVLLGRDERRSLKIPI
jgi:O-antigen/teichoic acid export membrane protein